MFFRVLLVVFGLFGPGVARAPFLREVIYILRIIIEEFIKDFYKGII